MKRFICIVLVLLLSLGILSSCANNDNNGGTIPEDPEISASAPESEEPEISTSTPETEEPDSPIEVKSNTIYTFIPSNGIAKLVYDNDGNLVFIQASNTDLEYVKLSARDGNVLSLKYDDNRKITAIFEEDITQANEYPVTLDKVNCSLGIEYYESGLLNKLTLVWSGEDPITESFVFDEQARISQYTWTSSIQSYSAEYSYESHCTHIQSERVTNGTHYSSAITMEYYDNDMPKLFKLTMEYDGRLLTEQYEWEYTNENRISVKTEVGYDEEGNILDLTKNHYTYDENGIVTDLLQEFEKGYSAIYKYDEYGQSIKYAYYNADGSEAYSYSYDNEYDERNNLIKKTKYNTYDKNDISEINEYHYDNEGNYLGRTEYFGSMIFKYDATGTLISTEPQNK